MSGVEVLMKARQASLAQATGRTVVPLTFPKSGCSRTSLGRGGPKAFFPVSAQSGVIRRPTPIFALIYFRILTKRSLLPTSIHRVADVNPAAGDVVPSVVRGRWLCQSGDCVLGRYGCAFARIL